MHRIRIAACAALLVSAAAVAVASPGGAAAAEPTRYPAAPTHGSLNSVAIFNSHLAWAIGTRPHGNGVSTLVERWNGQRWAQVAVPSEPGHDVGFGDIAGSSPHDIWAVGSYSGEPGQVSFADHWDGLSWTRVPFPNHQQFIGSIVQGLSVVSPDDAWASGLTASTHPWVLHWDGTAWRQVPCRNIGTTRSSAQVWGVAAFSATDAWIVGTIGSGTISRSLAVHWDGTAWTRVATPSLPNVDNVPWSISASSPDDIWAGGYWIDGHTGAGGPFLMHWDGTAWTLAALPKTGKYSQFYTVSAASPDDAWAVGWDGVGALAMHWDGTSWRNQSPPAPAGELVGVDDQSPRLAIAVGSFKNGNALHEIWNGSSWR